MSGNTFNSTARPPGSVPESSGSEALYPFIFEPIFKERVWGGRTLETLYGKPLPAGVPIGESWEISDRPGDASRISNGSLSGKDLSWLMQNRGAELLGRNKSDRADRFPLLIKILDAREKLSLQVHPPAAVAAKLKGEPKTEMWFITQADPGAELYAGLKRGVTRTEFEQKIRNGTVADCFHRVPVSAGDAMFLPSGRVHAIGAGLVIFEIQQNSDTTYRVFDWNRVGLDGKARELHVQQSLASIDFNDFEPRLAAGAAGQGTEARVVAQWGGVQPLVRDALFWVDRVDISVPFSGRFVSGAEDGMPLLPPGRLQIIGLVSGRLAIQNSQTEFSLSAGGFCLIPAAVSAFSLYAPAGTSFLRTTI